MDIEVIDEGIEREEQARVLKHMKCCYSQVYSFSRPVPLAQLQDRFDNRYDLFLRSSGGITSQNIPGEHCGARSISP